MAADLFVTANRPLCDISLPFGFRSFWQQVCVESKCTGAFFHWMWIPVSLKNLWLTAVSMVMKRVTWKFFSNVSKLIFSHKKEKF